MGKSSNGTANIVNDKRWMDTGDRGGYGGPVVMAAIDAGELDERHAAGGVTGETWWRGVEHLRDLGFAIPELEEPDDYDPEQTSGGSPNTGRSKSASRRGWIARPSRLASAGTSSRASASSSSSTPTAPSPGQTTPATARQRTPLSARRSATAPTPSSSTSTRRPGSLSRTNPPPTTTTI
ncbi:hypothetical protein ACFQL1_15790 [Halomicroarcula sp. GCM10025709]|uniref:hypothetical protein n=1 Tax=Halomicroarcula sp. GCM10025709 TaxID=3252669 RepID=UPI00360F9216